MAEEQETKSVEELKRDLEQVRRETEWYEAEIERLRAERQQMQRERAEEEARARAKWERIPEATKADRTAWRATIVANWLNDVADCLVDHVAEKPVRGGPLSAEHVRALDARVEEIWSACLLVGEPRRYVKMHFLDALSKASAAPADEQRAVFINSFGTCARAMGIWPSEEAFREALAHWNRGPGARGGIPKWEGLAAVLKKVGLGQIKARPLREDWGNWKAGRPLKR